MKIEDLRKEVYEEMERVQLQLAIECLEKKETKLANQKKELSLLLEQKAELQRQLNIANNTVSKQIDGFNTMEKHYESILKVQDFELDRRMTIINYLEDRLRN